MTIGIMFDWSKNYNENDEPTFDLTCPNSEHHDKFGYGWETKYEATEDTNGDKCEPYQGCPCCEDDSGNLAPMMNFIYPLDYKGFIEGDEGKAKRVKIASETNCVCVYKEDTDEWFLTLTGGGMDLSPSIAYAYVIAQKWLPVDLLQELSPGWCKDSLSEEHFKELREICIEQTTREADKFVEKSLKWRTPVEEIVQ